jgi:hypothetical protein
VLIFFTFSTTQEYYSMPCYPAFALLLGSTMATENVWVRRGTRTLAVIAACTAIAAFAIYWNVRNLPAPGDISSALSSNPKSYSLSLGHMLDLTLASFAYLRIPLLLASIAFFVGALGNFRTTGLRAFLASALMMILFFHAARAAMVVFDPYLSSRPLAEALLKSPDGSLIVERHYYPTSSIFFYSNRTALLLNGRIQNLEYGSNAPDAPDIFIDDTKFANLWMTEPRFYLVAAQTSLPRLQTLVGPANLNIVSQSGGKLLLTNHPLPTAPQPVPHPGS